MKKMSFHVLTALSLLAAGCATGSAPPEQAQGAGEPVIVEDHGTRAISDQAADGSVVSRVIDINGENVGFVEWTNRQMEYTFGSIHGSTAMESPPVVRDAGGLALAIWKKMPVASSGSHTEYDTTCSGFTSAWGCDGECQYCLWTATVNADCTVDVTTNCAESWSCRCGLPIED